MTTRARLRVIPPHTTLHSHEGGQISALGVMAAAAFACLLLLVVNTGHATSGKIEMQNAADATAISGATWIARGLNVISLNNVTQTQVLAVILIVRALDDALPLALTTLQIERAACAALVVGAPLCAAIIGTQIVGLQEIQTVVRSVGRPLVRQRGILWNALLAMEAISDVIKNSFVVVAEIEADRIARQNGADLGFVVPAGLRVTLPVRKGAMRPDLCDPTRSGSPSNNSRGYAPLLGYDVGEGPFERYSNGIGPAFYLFENSLIRLYFAVARESHFMSLCGASGGGPRTPRERPVGSLALCRLAGGGTATWVIVIYRTIRFDAPQPGITLRDNDPRLDGRPQAIRPPQQQSCSWTPPGAAMSGNRYRSVREIVENPGTGPDGTPVRRYRYEFTDYMLLSAVVADRTPQPPSSPLPSESASPSNPDPYLLLDQARESMRYLAVVYRSVEESEQVAPRYFTSPFGRHRLAYAQARVYNPTAFDTFTQDWQVGLEPASLIEDGTVLGALGSPVLELARTRNGAALSRLSESATLFGDLTRDLNLLRYLNNH